LIGIRDLARYLDISTGTVSRALNEKTDVNPLTRQRVREAAAKLGYSPNQAGRSLRRGQTDLIGMIIPTGSDAMLINQVFLSVLDGLRRTLTANRLDLAIFLQGQEEDSFVALRRLTEKQLADGLIIADTLHVDPRIDYLIEKQCPFVAFGRSLSGGKHAWVDPDFEGAVASAIECLYQSGHRQIGLILPKRPTHYVHLIEKSFTRELAKRRLKRATACVKFEDTQAGGGKAAEYMLSTHLGCTSLVLTDANQIVGVYRRLIELGLRPGKDISVIGLLPERRDDFLSPVLTTIQTDWTAVGAKLGEALIGQLDGRLRGASSARALSRPKGQKPAAQQILVPIRLNSGESLHQIVA
jgi:DNA-binding LacI/PurR family transcriptional regulator